MIRNELAALEARLAEAHAASLAATAAVEAALSRLTGEPVSQPPVTLPSEPAPQHPPALPAPDHASAPPKDASEAPKDATEAPEYATEPTWMPAAWAEWGVRETAGSGHNPRVVALFRDAGHAEVRDDETAWCAALVGAVLERSGARSTRSLLARSYLTWGEPLGNRRAFGAIAVFSRGSDPALGHVGFVVGMTPDGDTLYILGGNQSNAVGVQPFPRSRLLPDGLRWPTQGVRPPADTVRPERDGTAGGLTPGPVPVPDGADNLPIFAVALAHVLQPDIEGGWSDDPDDPGGATNYGITIGDYARYRGAPVSAALKEQLRTIGREEVADIYLRFYWREGMCAALPAPIGVFHFDCCVNQGVPTAARLLQRALQVDVDGEIGPITLGAARQAKPMALLEVYAELRRSRYRASPRFWKYGNGWLKRVDKTLATAAAVAIAVRA